MADYYFEIDLARGSRAGQVPPQFALAPDALVRRLSARMEELRLSGLSALGVRSRSGVLFDSTSLFVDPDAGLLFSYAQDFKAKWEEGLRDFALDVYLADGTLIIDAEVKGERTTVRAGESREAGEPMTAIEVPTAEYVLMWDRVTAALLERAYA